MLPAASKIQSDDNTRAAAALKSRKIAGLLTAYGPEKRHKIRP
jgi:hypothetical protein